MSDIFTHKTNDALPMIISFADRLNAFTRTTLNKELDSYGLKFNQWRLIHAISSKSIFTPAKLADELMIERATVSRYLDQLEEKQCIRRSHNRLDRRVVDIELTATGDKIAQFGIDLMDKAYKDVLTDLTPVENKNFITLIEKLTENIPSPNEQASA
jgi:DNA-binding MarR family transcriptional regulator